MHAENMICNKCGEKVALIVYYYYNNFYFVTLGWQTSDLFIYLIFNEKTINLI